MIAVVDKGKRIKAIGAIECYEYNIKSKQLTISTKCKKHKIDTTKHKVTIKKGHSVVDVFKGL